MSSFTVDVVARNPGDEEQVTPPSQRTFSTATTIVAPTAVSSPFDQNVKTPLPVV
jgi:hypothetical protein